MYGRQLGFTHRASWLDFPKNDYPKTITILPEFGAIYREKRALFIVLVASFLVYVSINVFLALFILMTAPLFFCSHRSSRERRLR